MADLKLVEVSVDHTVFMKVDFLAVRHRYEAVVLKELTNLAMSGRVVSLHSAAHPSRMIFHLSSRSVEGITDSDIHIFMRMVEPSRMPHVHIFPRHTEINAYVIEVTAAMVMMGRLDNDPAAHDSIREVFEFGGFLANARFDRWRRLHAVKTYL
ncbi:MAG: hypothetical protein PVF41_06150 [Methyloceanibacter sp.]|jgi:hypothetical protein